MPFPLQRTKIKKQFRTAQSHTHLGAERTPEKKGMFCLLKASLTVEAALVFPLFLIFMFALIYPMKVMDASLAVQKDLEAAGSITAAAEGIYGTVSKESREEQKKEAEKVAEEETEESGGKSSGAFREILSTAETALNTVNLFASCDYDTLGAPVPTVIESPTEEDPMVKINVTAFVKFPYCDRLTDFFQPLCFVSEKRAWVGRKGGAGREEETTSSGTQDSDTDTDRTVYVARNSEKSGRYHVSSKCHYIDNEPESVSIRDVVNRRSKGGSRYHPCPSCHPEECENVYIFKSGTAYHSTMNCKATGYYVEEMKESEAKERGLTPCHTCGCSH